MLYRNEYIYEGAVIESIGEDQIMLEMCHKFAEIMPQSVKLEHSRHEVSRLYYGEIYRAEVHVFHPDEMDKIYNALLELKNLQLTTFETNQRLMEIAKILGFTKQINSPKQ